MDAKFGADSAAEMSVCSSCCTAGRCWLAGRPAAAPASETGRCGTRSTCPAPGPSSSEVGRHSYSLPRRIALWQIHFPICKLVWELNFAERLQISVRFLQNQIRYCPWIAGSPRILGLGLPAGLANSKRTKPQCERWRRTPRWPTRRPRGRAGRPRRRRPRPPGAGSLRRGMLGGLDFGPIFKKYPKTAIRILRVSNMLNELNSGQLLLTA